MEDESVLCAFSTHVFAEDNSRAEGASVQSDPSDVVVNLQGHYVVADSLAGVVRTFDRHGSYVRDVGAKHLSSVWGVLVTNSGKLVVSDPASHDLKVFSSSGHLLLTSKDSTHLIEPRGIAYHRASCRVAVADQVARCVYVHDPSGRVKDVLKVEPAHEVPPMSRPSYVAFGAADSTLVSDTDSHCVYCFDAKGELSWTFGAAAASSTPAGRLSSPCGMAVDTAGRVLVADCEHSRVVVLGPDGHYQDTALSWTAVTRPRGLYLQDDKSLVVTEGGTGVVKVFDYNRLLPQLKGHDAGT